MTRKLIATDDQVKEAIETSETIQEAAKKLGVKEAYISHRAWSIRKKGVTLEKFKTGKKIAPVAA